jgi:anaerobic magnesium-protoporphyrin IX monomethyl ester cyclase
MPHVCLINPRDPICEDTQWDEPLGLLYLAATLEKFKIPVEVIDLNFHDLNILDKSNANWFGIYCSSSLLNSVLELNHYIKERHPGAKTMVGGPHATCMPQDFIKDFDKIIIGEGEMAILSAFTSTSQVITCLPIENLDRIPYPARHLIPIKEYHRRIAGQSSVGLMTSRGCPSSCAFCSKVWGKTVRFRSAKNVIGEVKECIEKYNIHAFNIRDDTFTLNRVRFLDMMDEFKNLNISWRCLTRVDQVDRDILNYMKKSGCAQIVYGLESGNQNILNNLGKGTTVKQNLEAIKLTKEVGIEAKAAVIVGNPGETWDTVKDTVNMIEDSMPDSVILCTFTPYPGSPVWNKPDKFKMKILTRDVSKYMVVGENMRGKVVIETEKMSARDIADAHEFMLNRFKELKLIK